MPVPVLVFIGLGVLYFCATLGTAGTVLYISRLQKKAEKKFINPPTGPPRPPRGTTRNEVVRAAQDRLKMDVIGHFNFAFCGGCGAGKSTLINALLNQEDVDYVPGKPHNMFGPAPTGVWQTTMDTKCYGYREDHNLKHVRLWDMAGCGTHEHPSATYFEDKTLFAFDTLLIVAEKELGEYEYPILENAQKENIPVIIVITMAEEKVKSKCRKLYNSGNPPLREYPRIIEETSNEARQRVSTCLEKRGLKKVPIFIVSAYKYRDYMLKQETFRNTNFQELIHDEDIYRNESLGEEVTDEVISHQILVDNVPRSLTAEEEDHMKNALLSFELVKLLDYMGTTALQRRL